MATVAFQKPRPKCSICGGRSHVITVANPRSPYLGCCAFCGKITAELLEVLRVADEQRLYQLVGRALKLNAGQSSLKRVAAAAE